jgi:hypothetical protein
MAAPKAETASAQTAQAEEVALRALGPLRPTNVIEAIACVMGELPAIGKDSKASPQQGGYAYRGIEAITSVAQSLFAKYCVVFVPRMIGYEIIDIEVQGKPWTDTRIQFEYDVYGPGGPEDKITVGPLLTIGRDNSDKGSNKCATQGLKYALLQVLCISDRKDDADENSYERDARSANQDTRNHNADAHEPPLWQRLGYESDEAWTAAREGIAKALKEIPADQRDGVKAWLNEHGYAAVIPPPIKADDLPEFTAELQRALGTPPDGAEPALPMIPREALVAAKEAVDAMTDTEVVDGLTKHGLPATGNKSGRKFKLATAMAREAQVNPETGELPCEGDSAPNGTAEAADSAQVGSNGAAATDTATAPPNGPGAPQGVDLEKAWADLCAGAIDEAEWDRLNALVTT